MANKSETLIRSLYLSSFRITRADHSRYLSAQHVYAYNDQILLIKSIIYNIANMILHDIDHSGNIIKRKRINKSCYNRFKDPISNIQSP